MLTLACLLAGLVIAGTGRADAALRCGDTIAGTVTLDADLGPCIRSALKLKSGAVLDCAGHAITGTGGAMDGVKIDAAYGAEVRNCRISGFRGGVRIRGGGAHRVLGNELFENTYGVEAAGGTDAGTTTGNRVEGNVIRDSRMDGIHLGAGTLGTEVRGNHVFGSRQENLYLLYCEGCVVTDNVLEGGGSAAIYLKHGKDNYLARNTVRDRPVQVRGDAVDNLFADNQLERAAFVFQAYDDRALGWVGFPHRNTVVGGSVTDVGVCLRFGGAHDNRVTDLLINGCVPASMKTLGGREPTGNVTDVAQASEDLDHDDIDDRADPCIDTDRDGFGLRAAAASTCPPDNCRDAFNPEQRDTDGDGVGDACDRCPLAPDPGRVDTDRDGIGDACDLCTDGDRDGFGERTDLCPADNCPDLPNPDQLDQDLDGIGDRCDRCPTSPATDLEHAGTCSPAPLAGLRAEEIARFRAGLDRFEHVETAASGLGPLFNGASCAECHRNPTAGGSSPRRVMRVARSSSDGFDPMVHERGSVLRGRGIRTDGCSQPGEVVPRTASVVGGRDTPPLYGAGLIEAIPADHIVRRADPLDADGDGISGRANLTGDRIGRFGWKAQTASLANFSAEAFFEEIGLTNPAFPAERGGPSGAGCDRVADPEDDGRAVAAVSDFMTMLAPPPAAKRTAAGRPGRRLFRRLGCNACHVETLQVGSHPSPALSGRHVRLFSDLLLHDMGLKLSDGIEQGEATGSEFRTAPLWGVAASAPYLHDGRAATLEEAISAHGGEANAARNRFRGLSKRERRALLDYVRSL